MATNDCRGGCYHGCYGASEGTASATSGCNRSCQGSCNSTCKDGSDLVSGLNTDRVLEGHSSCYEACSVNCGLSGSYSVGLGNLINSYKCSNCMGSCTKTCSMCEDSCKNQCQGECKDSCNVECSDEERTVPRLKKVMDADNIKELFNFLVEEAERRRIIVETDFEYTIRMIARVAQLGQGFFGRKENIIISTGRDFSNDIIKDEVLKELANKRDLQISRNQILFQSLNIGTIPTTDNLLRLFILLPELDTTDNGKNINKSCIGLLNDILFNRASFTSYNFSLAISGEYKSVLEKENVPYLINFVENNSREIYSLLMMLYIVYNGQEGFNHQIYKILQAERLRLYNDSNIVTNSDINKLLKIVPEEDEWKKDQKRLAISELLFYHFRFKFMPNNYRLCSWRMLNVSATGTIESVEGFSESHNTQNEADQRVDIVSFKDGVGKDANKYYYYLPFLVRPSFMRRIQYYDFIVEGNQIKKILSNDKLTSSENNAGTEISQDREELNNSYLELDYLDVEKFENDLKDYNIEDITPYIGTDKDSLTPIYLSYDFIQGVLQASNDTTFNWGNIEKIMSKNDKDFKIKESQYFLPLENTNITQNTSNISNEIQIATNQLLKTAQRIILYRFQYGTSIYENPDLYPYYDILKAEYELYYNNAQQKIEQDTTISENLKLQLKNSILTVQKYFENLENVSTASLYGMILSGADKIIYANNGKYVIDDLSYGMGNIDVIKWDNIFSDGYTNNQYIKNPHKGFMYEIYSVIMAALVKNHGQSVLHAQEDYENDINPYNQLFRIVAEERIKILGEDNPTANITIGNDNFNPAYDPILAKSKLLNHIVSQKSDFMEWDGYSGTGSISPTCGYPDVNWDEVDFAVNGSYPANTKFIINALNFADAWDFEAFAVNKNILFTDIVFSNINRIVFVTVPYCFSKFNTWLVMNLKTINYEVSENENISNTLDWINSQIEKIIPLININKPILYQIIEINVIQKSKNLSFKFYMIYDKQEASNNNDFSWKYYPDMVESDHNPRESILLGKTLSIPKDFSAKGAIGLLEQELQPIPDSYKEAINSLENNSENIASIIENDVPMIFEDVLINVFKKNLGNNYQSGTLTRQEVNKILMTTDLKNKLTNYFGKSIYNKLMALNVSDSYFEKHHNSETWKIKNNKINEFWDKYIKNPYNEDYAHANLMSAFNNEDVNLARLNNSIVWANSERAQKWFEIAKELWSEEVPVYDAIL